jgi:hypothetical protein
MEIIGGLAFLGQYFNGRNDKQVLEKNKSSLRKESDDGDIYSREYFTKSNKGFNSLLEKRTQDSRDPNHTGIIPKYYNLKESMKGVKQKPMNYELFTEGDSDCGNSCGSSSSAQSGDPNFFIKAGNKMSNNRRFESKIDGVKKRKNEFLNQFDDMCFNNSNEPIAQNGDHGSAMNSAVNRLQNDRELTVGYSSYNDEDMTYGVVGKQNFTHNNMKPFFKKTHGGLAAQHLGQQNQRSMELHTGSIRDGWKHKQESGPRFDPVVGFTNIYGTPVMTDYYESRYVPGKERRNELPFQQIKVAPGLGLGTKGGQATFIGGGDLYRVLPQTLPEQLRPTKPKSSGVAAVHNVGQKGSNGPVAGATEKRRPDQFVAYDPKNMVKTGGNISAPRLSGEIQHTGRWRGHAATNHTGPAQYANPQSTPTNLMAKQKQTNKISFKQSGPTNVHLVDGLRGRSNKLDDTYIPDATQRGTSTNRTGALGRSDQGKSYTYDTITNIPDPTRREQYEKADRIGNAVSGGAMKSTTINYDNVPELTLRDIHNQSGRVGVAVQGDMYKVKANDPNDVLDYTLRDMYNQFDRPGKATTGEYQKGRTVDPNDVLDYTKRDMHNQYDRTGKATTGDFQKGRTVDPNDVLDYTKRDMHNQYDRTGKATTGDFQKGRTVDPNDVLDYTKRDMHNQYDRTGKATTGEYQKGKTFDPNDVLDYTKRDMHNQYDRTGKATTGEYQKGKTFDPNDVLDYTKRDMHNQYDRTGKATTGEYQKGKTFDPNDVLDYTKRDIHNQYDRTGKATTGEYQKGKTFDPNDVLDYTKRDMHNQYDRTGKATTGEYQKGKTFDPNDVLDLTLRDIHNKLDRNGVLEGNGRNGYTINYTDATPDMTKREIHSRTDRNGVVEGNGKNGYTINYTDATPDMTKREIHSKTDRNGVLEGNGKNGYTINYTDATPDMTKREIHSRTDRNGVVEGNGKNGYTINYTDATPDMTKREIHSKTDRNGVLEGNGKSGYTINYIDATPDITNREMTGHTNRRGTAKNDVDGSYTINYVDATPDITVREMTGHTNRRGTAKNDVDGSYVINYVDATPDITNREMTGHTSRANPAKSEVSKEGLRMNYANAETNTAKEQVAKGRTPTQVKYNVGPTNDFTQYDFREDNENQIRRTGGMGLMNQSMDRLPQIYSKNRNDTFFVNDRATAFPQSTLVGNPYINNAINNANYTDDKIKGNSKITFNCDVF